MKLQIFGREISICRMTPRDINTKVVDDDGLGVRLATQYGKGYQAGHAAGQAAPMNSNYIAGYNLGYEAGYRDGKTVGMQDHNTKPQAGET
jgi:hypothetical protein